MALSITFKIQTDQCEQPHIYGHSIQSRLLILWSDADYCFNQITSIIYSIGKATVTFKPPKLSLCEKLSVPSKR